MIITWRYHSHHSLMESFDPRTCWIFSLAFLFSVTMFWDARFLVFFFVLAFLWYFSGRTRWSETKRGWMLVSILLFTMIVINTLITGGGAGGVVPEGGRLIWPEGIPLPFGILWHFGLTYDRLWFAVCQVLRIGSISAMFLAIPFTMDPRLYGVTFRRMGIPDKLAYSMELAFRYVPTLGRDFSTTYDAQRARGYELERLNSNIFQQIARIAPLVIPVTMNSILAGEDIANAMDLRCFGTRPREWLYELKFRRRDYILLAFGALMLLASFALTTFPLHLGKFWVPAFLTVIGG
jgi:energy-coupling factor transport system permease protein